MGIDIEVIKDQDDNDLIIVDNLEVLDHINSVGDKKVHLCGDDFD